MKPKKHKVKLPFKLFGEVAKTITSRRGLVPVFEVQLRGGPCNMRKTYFSSPDLAEGLVSKPHECRLLKDGHVYTLSDDGHFRYTESEYTTD